ITFIEIFSQASIGPAIVQRHRIEARHLRTALGLAITIGTVTGVGIWFLAGGLAALLRMPDLKAVLRVLAALILTRSPAVVAEAQLYRELQFRFLANSTIAVELLGYGAIGVILAKAGWGVWALVAALYAQALLRTCVLLVRCPPALPPLPDWRTVNELMRFGGGSTAATIANEAAQQADKIA